MAEQELAPYEQRQYPSFVVLCFCWVIVAPWLFAALGYLIGDSLNEGGIGFISILFGSTFVIAVLTALFGGFFDKDKRGRRRWWISVTTFVLVAFYLFYVLSNARFG